MKSRGGGDEGKEMARKVKSNKKSAYDKDSDDADEAIFGAPDASNGLSYAKVKYEMDKRHPRRLVKNADGVEEAKTYPVCSTSTGMFSCCLGLRRSDLAADAPGLVLYFQFLKYMTGVFTILLVLAIPNMLFFYHGQPGNINGFNSAITSLSVGNIEAAKPACAIGKFNKPQTPIISSLAELGVPADAPTAIDREVSLVLSCTVGTLHKLNDIGQVPAS